MCLRRSPLTDVALFAVAGRFSVLAFRREGMPLEVLGVLGAPTAWAAAAPMLAALVLMAAAGAAAYCVRRRPPAPLRAALFAAAATSGFGFGYDWCAHDALRFLPTTAGCHCWIVGVAAALAAIAVALLVFAAHALASFAVRGLARFVEALFVAPRSVAHALRAPPLLQIV